LAHAVALVAKLREQCKIVAREFVKIFLEDLWKPFADAGYPQERWAEVTESIERLRPLSSRALLASYQITVPGGRGGLRARTGATHQGAAVGALAGIAADLISLIQLQVMTSMTATEVSRNFSAVINRVAAGEEIEIVRNGATVAELRQPPRPRRLAGEAWRAFIAGLPAVDGDFARDVEEARASVGPPVSRWPAG
jgi:antitoxin (DNA-binding transcriptional repressor) of toxin-antitoxin stability system